jgi:hypothetical protein
MSEILLVNPTTLEDLKMARHRKGHMPAALRRYWATHKRKGNPHHHRRHHRRHNPSLVPGGIMGSLKSGATSGLTGALGALFLDLLWGYTNSFLPSMLQSSYGMYLGKAVGAVAVGAIGGKVMPGKGRDLTVGAFTVLIHDVLKSTLVSVMPTLPLSGYVGTSPIIAYGAPAVGVPQLGTPFRSAGIPSAHRMGAYTDTGRGVSMAGFTDGGPDGTDWS